IDTLQVSVAPTTGLVVDAGPDLTAGEGDAIAFQATVTDGDGTVMPWNIAWDFDYDGQNFQPDGSANGTLTPSYQYLFPGSYLVAVRVTDSNFVTRLGTLYVDYVNA